MCAWTKILGRSVGPPPAELARVSGLGGGGGGLMGLGAAILSSVLLFVCLDNIGGVCIAGLLPRFSEDQEALT